MKMLPLQEVRNLIAQAIEKEEKYIVACKGNDNPQVIEMRLKAEGKLEAFEDVLLALRGDVVNLRIDAKGFIS